MHEENYTQTEEKFNPQLSAKWGRLVLGEGGGGGFTTKPDALYKYERALGVEPLEMWLLDRLLRHYWKAGEEVYPSFSKIEREAIIGRTTLRALRRQLEAKGFIRVTGQREQADNRNTISLEPLRMALSLCVLCDPQSKIAARQRRANIRKELTEMLGNDPALYSWFEGRDTVGEIELPLDMETAKAVAGRHGITLNWQEIAAMQKRAETVVKKDSEHYQRLVYLKSAVAEAAEGWFTVRWSFQSAYKLLLWLEAEGVSAGELYAITKEYTQSLHPDKKHSFKAFEAHVRASVASLKVGGGLHRNRGAGLGANQHIHIHTSI